LFIVVFDWFIVDIGVGLPANEMLLMLILTLILLLLLLLLLLFY